VLATPKWSRKNALNCHLQSLTCNYPLLHQKSNLIVVAVGTRNHINCRSMQTFNSTPDFENRVAEVNKHILPIKPPADGCCK